jgi:glutamate N-acetyltransferase/amino-acid N-acetyltransferase
MTSPELFLPKVFLPQGFSFASGMAGIKASGRPDLAFIEASAGTTAAAVFTKNRVVAAPLIVARESLAKSKGRVRAVVVNSGNANCATGKPGITACREVCAKAAALLGVPVEDIFSSSTGIIGVPLPAGKILAKLPEVISTREASTAAAQQFANTIMTTDTRPKLASVRVKLGKKEFSLLGIAKGAGMIHPQMATMLVYLMTDIAAPPAKLQALLRAASDETFNCLSIDGDTSTNDTALLLASGQSGIRLTPLTSKKFAAALLEVCQSLAQQIVSDGEGVKHVILLRVEQAKTRAEALQVAKAIAHSLLVKTAWAGADPNWGRILSTIGSCRVPVNPQRIDIAIGSQTVFSKGAVRPFDEQQAHAELSQPACDVRVRLHRGKGAVLFLTTDLTAEYVHINADYST